MIEKIAKTFKDKEEALSFMREVEDIAPYNLQTRRALFVLCLEDGELVWDRFGLSSQQVYDWLREKMGIKDRPLPTPNSTLTFYNGANFLQSKDKRGEKEYEVVTVADLVKALLELPNQNAVLFSFNHDNQDWEPYTGLPSSGTEFSDMINEHKFTYITTHDGRLVTLPSESDMYPKCYNDDVAFL